MVEALESLDGRLSAASRRVVGRALPSTASLALPPALKARLQALTRRWTGATNLQQLRKEPRPPKAKAEARPVAPVAPARAEDLRGLRSKFVGILMRAAARGAGQASFDACAHIERALFAKCGEEPKEYRRRARSASDALLRPLGKGLSHNLAGELLQQVLNGSVTAEKLVAMEPEDLAPASVKAHLRAF